MEYKRHKFARLFSVFAAAMLAVSSTSVMSAAAETAKLEFEKGEGGDNSKAFVLTGRNINMKETLPKGFLSKGISIKNADTNKELEKDSGISISNDNKAIRIDEKFDPSMGKKTTVHNPALSAKGVYALEGNYYALLAEGTVAELTPHQGSFEGLIKSQTRSAITEYSTCKIECIAAETSSAAPKFKLVPNSKEEKGYKRTGAFAKYSDNATVSVISVSKDIKKKEVAFAINEGNNRIEFVMYPKATYDIVTKDMGTPSDEGKPELEAITNKPIPKEPDSYIRKGTEFDIIFRMPVSNPLFLTVLTPQAAMKEIESEIENCDGVGNTNYIKLGKGDGLNYLTQNFQLLRALEKYSGANFTIKWEWKPSDKQVIDGKQVAFSSLTANQQENYKNALRLSDGNSNWQIASIYPQEDDIAGTLTATVSYTLLGGSSQKTHTTELPYKNILIRGIGKPVNVEQISQKIGKTDETFKDKTLPKTKTMDAYQGDIPEYKISPKGAYEYQLRLNMGAKNGSAKYAIIEAEGNTDSISITTQQGAEAYSDYRPGTQIPNIQMDSKTEGLVNMKIRANQLPMDVGKQSVTLTFKFFIPDRNGKVTESSRKFSIRLNMNDSTPSQDSSLKSLTIKDENDKEIVYPFRSDKFLYSGVNTVHIPYHVKSVSFTPNLNDPRGSEKIKLTVKDSMGNVIKEMKTDNGKRSDKIELPEVNKVISVQILSPAQDPREEYWTTYQVDLVKDPPSEDNTLKSLGLYYPDDKNLSKNILGKFDPEVIEYNVMIPYSTDKLRVKWEKSSPQAKGPELNMELEGANPSDPDKQWLTNIKQKFKKSGKPTLDLTFKVVSESESARTYTIHIRRMDPSKDGTLKSLKVTDEDEKDIKYTPSFRADKNTYTANIPYRTGKIKLELVPNDTNISNIKIYSKSNKGEPVLEMQKGEIKPGALTKALEVYSIDNPEVSNVGYHSFYIEVWAENETDKAEYELRVVREMPSDDAALKSLEIFTQDKKPVKTLAFHPDEYSYSLKVPYEMEGVSFKLQPNYEYATITLKEEGGILPIPDKVTPGTATKTYKLNPHGESKTFEITVTAEDGKTTKTYNISFTRENPSSDARLKGLSVKNAEDFKPIFISDKTEYTASCVVGAPGVIITATANHPHATIRINGEVVNSGTPSELIELIKIKSKIPIEVTAQDGITKKTYNIEFTNENLVERTSNADLRSLRVNYGQMTPNFKPAVTEYEIATTENTYSVDIIPRTSDPLAEMKVFSGSREIGDYNGNYSQALEDGENEIRVEVTSPDKKNKKSYSIRVYRKEEDKLKNLAPLTAAEIDFESSENPIVVMIDEYPRVSADVFEKLKQYPDKTIIFQGNDYSLTFNAKDLNKVIPKTEIYDFRMYFSTLQEEEIWDIMYESSKNDDLIDDYLTVYFPYHGSLPGRAVLRLGLGSKYANQRLYWHYYNMERDRIDYYGYLNSNSRGNVAVYIDHFSTYIATRRHHIVGSENKSHKVDAQSSASQKTNPNTGAKI